MQLTRFTDLGLRILMQLARSAVDGSALTTRSVADQMAVKYAHAAKVVARLQTLGVVETRRGGRAGWQEAFFRERDPFTVPEVTWSPTVDVLLSLSVRPSS